jgi:hypothetical protein
MFKLITAWELQHRTDTELCALFQKVSQEMVKTEPGTDDHRNACGSLENIKRAINSRQAPRPKPPCF